MAGPIGEGGVRYWVVRSDWVGVDGEGGGIIPYICRLHVIHYFRYIFVVC
jgi:hypothetical protein